MESKTNKDRDGIMDRENFLMVTRWEESEGTWVKR